MAIYADKRNGKLTGKWRVELQRAGERYRHRHESHQEALEDEKRVLAAWDAGLEPEGPPVASKGSSGSITFAKGIELARGRLWDGLASEEGSYLNLRVIEAAIGADTALDAIDTSAILTIKRALKERGLADGTTNRYLSNLKTFLTWQIMNKHRTVPLDGIQWEWRKESKGRLRWITFEEEDVLLSLVPQGTAKLIKVAIATGCRREELLSLKAHQIDQDGGEDGLLHLWKTKNDEARSVPISVETAGLLRDLVGGEMPTKRTLRRHWDVAKREMNLEDDGEFVFHACRHTCATRMVEADVDILVIKEWLGHKRIETTQRYAKVGARKLRSILARVGDLRQAEAKISQISASPRVPHTSPHVGGIEQIKVAV